MMLETMRRLTFFDWDQDEDWDLVVGDSIGGLHFFLNVGDKNQADFFRLTGGANPFEGIFCAGKRIASAR